MPLKALKLKPGVNKENTRYTNESGWYSCDKVRFRQGSPEKIGGWTPLTTSAYTGVCRFLTSWSSLGGESYLGVGTNAKFYIENGSALYDITPLRDTATLNNPFTATAGSAVITVADTAHGATTGDYVTFSSAVGLGGTVTASVLNREFQVTVVNANSYTITVSATANATDAAGSPGGGGAVSAAYQISPGLPFDAPSAGWGAGTWSNGTWGDSAGTTLLRLWSGSNFGEDLIFGVRGGGLYYWDATGGLSSHAVLASSLVGASDVPVVQNLTLVSDVSRFVLCFGTNDPFADDPSMLDPMLIRWSDQESVTQWTPAVTNQAGSLRLSKGSMIVAAIQVRQEILVWTDTALYSLQYLGAPAVWGATLLADNISIAAPNVVAVASGAAFWMGRDKFYVYDGRLNTIKCDLLRYVYTDLNRSQSMSFFGGTNEGFNEVWWFYCSTGAAYPDRYVIFNYAENLWYYGTMERTAWLDSGLRGYPIAATSNLRLVYHESGTDDDTTGVPAPIEAYIESGEFDIEDGHNFGFVWRVVPDLTFVGSTAANPRVNLSLTPLQNSGSGYGVAVGQNVTRTATVPVEKFTGQVYLRLRGRQMMMKVYSNTLGTTWQLGVPRIDVRLDGRR